MHTLTGLAHDRDSHVAYDPDINEEGLRARSLKLAALQKTLKPPPVFGDDEGDLLVIGWGSTRAPSRRRSSACATRATESSSVHLQLPAADGAGHR